jgi:hypothetical protein
VRGGITAEACHHACLCNPDANTNQHPASRRKAIPTARSRDATCPTDVKVDANRLCFRLTFPTDSLFFQSNRMVYGFWIRQPDDQPTQLLQTKFGKSFIEFALSRELRDESWNDVFDDIEGLLDVSGSIRLCDASESGLAEFLRAMEELASQTRSGLYVAYNFDKPDWKHAFESDLAQLCECIRCELARRTDE